MRLIILCAVVSMIACSGCASAPARSSSNCPHAECLVCKANADLACVDVAVDAQTPRCVFKGGTYYFCSDECREKFQRSPVRYLSK